MTGNRLRKGGASIAALAAVLVVGLGPVASQAAFAAVQHDGESGHSSGQAGGHSGSTHGSEGDHGSQGKQSGKGRASGEAGSRSHGSLEDIFREIGSEEDDSDRPDWAGAKGGKNEHGGQPGTAGTERGDLYGDMYVILRDDNGVPILTPEGFVQPIDAEGNPIPLDAEGAPIDPSLAIEVDMSRLNVGRAPTSVLLKRADEVVALLDTATAISLDPAGRLVVTSPDGTSKTIDAPLENLAIYVALMTTGTIPGVTDLPGTEYDYLVDGKFTTQDMLTAASLLAGASDKFESITPDTVAYINAILGINTVKTGDITYSSMDYSTFSYDRADAYQDVTATVLVQQTDGTWKPTEVNIYEAVFKDTDYTSESGFDGFAQAVEDAREVINYIHEYAVPVEQTP
ncbi:hypothetical protein RXV95_11290 [Novosphingobium sp. ZN18A2]|uniref:hypothetical protein n=1 Tax=Novosphingobium sp. ZN18A2 TaxID=3079861 RepID=UPI0030D5366A